ncbi:hypothetical protein PpBr36_05230, partial [Pyricularia pennisetigena]|uniref:hypothetical protein n=1 Tax=Pyricularia pennisetigena TaxID=1578925 RepID=UPI001152FA4E
SGVFDLFTKDTQFTSDDADPQIFDLFLPQIQCAIQDCLTKNGYKEEKCQGVIDALYDCCKAFYEKNGDDASTVSCPKPDLLRLKLKQRQEAAGKKS